MKTISKLLIIIFTISLFNSFTSSQWVQTTSGTSNFLTSIQCISTVTNYAAGFGGTVLKSTNGGGTWQSLTSPSASNINKIFFPPTGNATTGWVASVGVFKSTNGGINWVQQIATGSFSDLAFVDLNTGFAVRSTIVSKTTNGGTNFTNINYTSNSAITANRIIYVTGQTVMILGVDNANDTTFVFKSTNLGDTWTQIFKTPGVFFDMKFVNLNTGMMCGNNALIKRTTNGGTSWNTITTSVSTDLSGMHFASSNIFYMVGSGGKILKSTNAGVNWFTQTCPVTANLRAIHVFSADDNGIIVGAGGTILRTTNGGITSFVQTGNEIPQSFSLGQNYPNPFNPQTTFSFSISKQEYVQLRVYDLLGKEAVMLVNENLQAGNYSVTFDASALPSGTYFYRITAGGFNEVKKMILIK
ncbi:MAG: T9SS type A sorting domain-containing protein [Ignavibacteria bacterium]|nr:T9SS type A sorting domain-containing protein [Ignavibacteria bacterium]